ncbi:hypothetical protein E5Q_05844 [Mixia osmundae IAM 14324]|uniref:AA1-like domain-containing protein n=1 Tax=Mixia osmundae (strain CBS 9802 / IAM 14324 / JCM 22182 / KY 12970) TaxID=764103 RepID=G7E8J3_MIXOS|nr:hypothetical protein E5Q_05844 [Mixia osmundae IAM 14324]
MALFIYCFAVLILNAALGAPLNILDLTQPHEAIVTTTTTEHDHDSKYLSILGKDRPASLPYSCRYSYTVSGIYNGRPVTIDRPAHYTEFDLINRSDDQFYASFVRPSGIYRHHVGWMGVVDQARFQCDRGHRPIRLSICCLATATLHFRASRDKVLLADSGKTLSVTLDCGGTYAYMGEDCSGELYREGLVDMSKSARYNAH